MDTIEVITSRRSIGKLAGEVSAAVVQELVEVAVTAPNHHLTQPWRFTIVAGKAREQLGLFWGTLTADAKGLTGPHREDWIAREKGRPLRAPVLIFVSCHQDPDPERAVEDLSATAAAIQNLILAAWAKNIGTMWRTGAMAYNDEVKKYLGIDPQDPILGIIYVGVPDAPPAKARPRRTDDPIVRWWQGPSA